MHSIATLAATHPELFAAIIWPLLTAILTAVLKPRTPEQYAALPPRLAALFQLVAALGLDPVKATEAAKKLVTGASRQKDLKS